MLIDAASSSVTTNSNSNTTNTGIRSRWDPTLTSTRGSQIITDYIRKCMVWTGNSTIDYAVLTHFHNDHFGGYTSSLPKSANSSTYSLIGFAEIFDNFKIGTLLDRGYPDYNYPFNMATMADNAPSCSNYINAVKWHVANQKFDAAIFKAGVNNQIVQKYNPAKYPTAKVQNVAVNGEIWTGSGTTTKKSKLPYETFITQLVIFSGGQLSLEVMFLLFSYVISESSGNVFFVVVPDGGNKYRVVTITDSDGAMTVKTISGPYTSR